MWIVKFFRARMGARVAAALLCCCAGASARGRGKRERGSTSPKPPLPPPLPPTQIGHATHCPCSKPLKKYHTTPTFGAGGGISSGLTAHSGGGEPWMRCVGAAAGHRAASYDDVADAARRTRSRPTNAKTTSSCLQTVLDIIATETRSASLLDAIALGGMEGDQKRRLATARRTTGRCG